MMSPYTHVALKYVPDEQAPDETRREAAAKARALSAEARATGRLRHRLSRLRVAPVRH